jgi:hypothetical protein
MKIRRNLLFNTAIVSIILLGMVLGVVPVQAKSQTVKIPIPILAYYYIWFDSTSWNRAKTDYPILGNYTSDDRTVMLQHIQWAKAAGIQGFIVSWKSTDLLNRRLQQLIEVADQENFKLVIIYQGLDFNRNPLPADRIASDMDSFIQNYASDPAFQLFSKPMVIWSGTWKFTPEEISSVTSTRRDRLLILSSEKNLDGYRRIASLVDGDAYYWSSVNPDTYTGYQDKMVSLSDEIHKNAGIWIPPAAPGFDARLVGGTTVVDRKNGDTLRTQINTAMGSSPDALGIISWNEYSENSQIEPSKNYGTTSLDVISTINHLPLVTVANFDSSEPSGTFQQWFKGTRSLALGGLAVLIVTGFVVLIVRLL